MIEFFKASNKKNYIKYKNLESFDKDFLSTALKTDTWTMTRAGFVGIDSKTYVNLLLDSIQNVYNEMHDPTIIYVFKEKRNLCDGFLLLDYDTNQQEVIVKCITIVDRALIFGVFDEFIEILKEITKEFGYPTLRIDLPKSDVRYTKTLLNMGFNVEDTYKSSLLDFENKFDTFKAIDKIDTEYKRDVNILKLKLSK